MNAFRTIKSVYLPSYGNTFSVGKDNVSAIAKTTGGVIVYYSNKTFVEYTDVRCVFGGETATISNGENRGENH